MNGHEKREEGGHVHPTPKAREPCSACLWLTLPQQKTVFSFKIADFHLQTITCSQEVTCFVFLCKLLGVVFVLETFFCKRVWGPHCPSDQADP